LLVLTEFPPSFGGMQTHAVELAARLEAAGYPISVLTYRGGAADAEEAARFDAALPYAVERSLSRVAYWRNVTRIARAARNFRADAIYSSTVYFGQASARAGLPMLCRSAGNDVLRPWIAWPFRFGAALLDAAFFERNLYPWLRRLDWPERLDRFLVEARTRVMRESAGAMLHVAANSEFTRQRLLEIGLRRDRIETIPGGVDIEKFHPGEGERGKFGWAPDAFVLLSACRLVAKKGLPLLLQAAADLAQEIPKLKLAIAGEGPEQAALAALAARLDIADRIHWMGRLKTAELAAAYRSANVFVFPSRAVSRAGGFRDAETMGRVLCEANASGLAVVAAATGGVPSIIRDGKNGLLFGEGGVEALRDALWRLYRDGSLRRRLGAEGRSRAVRDFAWERIFARQRAAITRVIFEGRSSILSETAGAGKPQVWELD
jgi:glycosyltransferase involved in cell wall biosynthesis